MALEVPLARFIMAVFSTKSDSRQELVGNGGRKFPHRLFYPGADAIGIIEELGPQGEGDVVSEMVNGVSG
jgi:hypothetical protein